MLEPEFPVSPRPEVEQADEMLSHKGVAESESHSGRDAEKLSCPP